MSAGEYCNRDVVIVSRYESVREVVNLMRSHHVGTVVVVEEQASAPVPVGILTDRDIVIEILAEGVDIDAVTIGDVMSFELVTISEDTKLLDAINIMRSQTVRRLPVVNSGGSLVGILTVDDVIELLSEQMSNIASLITSEQRREQVSRS